MTLQIQITKSYYRRQTLIHSDTSGEVTNEIETAIAREKQIKAGSRKKKIDLIKSINPAFKDLYPEL